MEKQSRYTKSVSTFTIRKRHQLINNGSIFERDWTTLGERHAIEPGKRRVYSDSGFLFTESTIPGTKKRSKTTKWSDAYTKDDLSPMVNGDVNSIKLPDSQDIRSYAYYGSAVELLRASIENIVKWFPGKAWSTGSHIYKVNNDGKYIYLLDIESEEPHEYELSWTDEETESKMWVLQNPFDLDFFRSGMTFAKYDNSLRNIPESYKKYYINGCDVISYVPWVKQYNRCDKDYTVIYEAVVTYADYPAVSKSNEFYNDYGVITEGNSEGLECVDFFATDRVYKTGKIYGVKVGNNVILCTDIKDFTIMPSPKVINDYFNGLDGFERLLLTKKSNPLYNCTLKVPASDGNYMMLQEFKFPSDGYCIDCRGIKYIEYVNELYRVAEAFDEAYCDNIWTNMTHEAIKNFDWTYKQDYEEGDADDNIFGGTRLKEVLRIYGRFFDDIKRYVDNIKLNNCFTLEGGSNLPSALLSDKAQLNGWEVCSTKLENNENLLLSSEYVENRIGKKLSRWNPANTIETEENDNDAVRLSFDCDVQPKWYPGSNPDSVSQNDADNYFMRMLAVNAPYLFSAKGTKHSIEMLYSLFGFGEEDIEIEERYYSVVPIAADKKVYMYTKVDEPSEYIEYEEISTTEYMTFQQYMVSLGLPLDGTEADYIRFNGICYDLTEFTFEELCAFVNENKSYTKNYEDNPYSGVPLGKVDVNGKKYIVPYFSQEYIYDGNVQFQTNGGWGKYMDEDIESERNIKYNYSETLPYVETVSNCNALTMVNKYSVKEKTLYYVMDISDIVTFTSSDYTDKMTHYFKLVDKDNPNRFESWSNIPDFEFQVPEEYNEYCNEVDAVNGYPLRPLYAGVNYGDYLYAKYCDDMVLDNTGNNPHTGNGKYDLGNDYLTYLEKPFNYSETHGGFKEEYLQFMASQIRFEVEEKVGEKIVVVGEDTKNYCIPSKVLVIRHTNTNRQYWNYFRHVISKYLMQIVPSTTILIFE